MAFVWADLDNYLSFEKSECESTVRNDGPIMRK